MKTASIVSPRRSLPQALRLTYVAVLLPVLFLLLSSQSVRAQHGSATWSSDGTENLWGSLADWTPAVIPNGATDTATFANSSTTYVDFDIFNDGTITLDGIHFAPGADAFTIADYSANMFFEGAGVVNDSGVTQSFITTGAAGLSKYYFDGTSTAGSLTAYTMQGGAPGNSGNYGIIYFNAQSSAASGTFTLEGGTGNNRFGGEALCSSNSTLDNASFTVNGGANSGKGGLLSLANSTNAAQSILVANGGTSGGAGGVILFKDDSLGGTAQVQTFGNGALDISGHNSPGITIGSIAGDGVIFLGAKALTIGSNNHKTAFSGVIQDGGASGGTGGSLVKAGRAMSTLSGANTYTGGTVISQGTLSIANLAGSGTGTGPVQVSRGSLAGTGSIAGAVTVGTGTANASLAPGPARRIGNLSLQSTLVFNSRAAYKADLSSATATADQVQAFGITISNGARATLDDLGSSALAPGTVFTIINNTAASPIGGTFSNLPDNSLVAVGGNTYRVSYEGGDGNDLTLTVQ
jgi:autotransporter-associated beta strand protein